MPMPNRQIVNGEPYRYVYQGQKKDTETGKEAFQLRLWDGRIGRWLTTDPYRQHASPYMAMSNNPAFHVDPDGGCDTPDSKCGWFKRIFYSKASENQWDFWQEQGYTNEDWYDILEISMTFKGRPQRLKWSPLPGSIVVIQENPNLTNFPDAYFKANASTTVGSWGLRVRTFGKQLGFMPKFGKETHHIFSFNLDQRKFREEGLYNPFENTGINPYAPLLMGNTYGASGGALLGGGILFDRETHALSSYSIDLLIGKYTTTYHTNGLFVGNEKRKEFGFSTGVSGAIFYGFDVNIEFGFILNNK